MKVITHNGTIVRLYCVAKIPIFFSPNSPNPYLFPTIYTLWSHPDLLYCFTISSTLESKLASGADLMLPGIILPKPTTFHSYGKMSKGTPVAVNTDENKAPIAVGLTALSSEDMYMSAGRGKCVEIYHIIGDSLCQLGKPSPKPELGVPTLSISDDMDETNIQSTAENSEILPALIDELEISKNDNDEGNNSDEVGDDPDKLDDEESVTNDIECPVETDLEIDPVQEMDELLEYCFLKACKSMKTTNLPILSSNFYKNHLIAACPPNKTIDIKKSKYKKLSVFLTQMKQKELINTSVVKGVESILSIKFEHPLLKSFVANEEKVLESQQPASANSVIVTECYRITADVLPIFTKYGLEKGDVLKRAEVRKCFTDYVKAENLQNGKILNLNPILAQILKTKVHEEIISMEDGINKFIGRMTRMHEITSGGSKLLHTGKLEPIDMRVTTRCNNKKVTLVNNLESFGINPKEFSKECQVIGASATITEDPGKKTPSVLIQGNQILYVYKLLTEKYQIKKIYIKGLEFAPKKKKGG
ncbi:eukaryotic translation initiation factor 2D isoform X2 [Prorops nasuta]